MARISVKMYATVREASGSHEILLEASTLAEALEALSESAKPGLKKLLRSYGLQEGGIVVLVNGMSAAFGDSASIVLSDGDEIAVFPPVSGG